jgi:hypothetical protein
MTTFKEALIEDLTSSGFSPDQALEVFSQLVERPEQASMKGRWDEDYTGYPAPIFSILLVAIRNIAFEYIKENMPNAWFRPIFDKEMAKKLGI